MYHFLVSPKRIKKKVNCLTDVLFLSVFNFLIYFVQGNTFSGQFVFGKLHGYKVLQYKDVGK